MPRRCPAPAPRSRARHSWPQRARRQPHRRPKLGRDRAELGQHAVGRRAGGPRRTCGAGCRCDPGAPGVSGGFPLPGGQPVRRGASCRPAQWPAVPGCAQAGRPGNMARFADIGRVRGEHRGAGGRGPGRRAAAHGRAADDLPHESRDRGAKQSERANRRRAGCPAAFPDRRFAPGGDSAGDHHDQPRHPPPRSAERAGRRGDRRQRGGGRAHEADAGSTSFPGARG